MVDCVPKLFYYGEILTRIFLVESYIPGTVYTSFDLMTQYASQCLDCVEALHKKWILHGDLRARNFIIDKNKVYIIDFGLSKILDLNDPESKELLDEEMNLIRKEFNR